MEMLPITVNPSKGKVVIVGGGYIGLHKAKNLLKFQIIPHIVSKEFHPDFEQLATRDKVMLSKKEVEWTDVEDAFLVVLVTDDEQVNDDLAKRLVREHKLVVHASNPPLGNVQMPASFNRGKLQISVATAGASPFLAVKIRNQLAEEFDDAYVTYVDFLYEVRQLVQKKISKRMERRKWLKTAVNDRYLHSLEDRHALLDEIRIIKKDH